MKYALERMDHLLRIVLQPATAGCIDTARSAQWLDMTAQEKENVINYLVHKALSTAKGQEFGLVIRHYQGMISQLMDFVHAQRNQHAAPAFKQFVRKVLDQLEELLLQIKERYHEYFDRRAKVPEPHLSNSLQRLRKEWSATEKKLKDRIADPALATILFTELPALWTEDRLWRYCDLSYAKKLVRELDRFQSMAKGSADDAFWHLLVYYNFNSVAFTNFLIDKIEADTRELVPQMKAQRLGYWFKQINQQPVASFIGIRPEAPTAKDVINNWLSQEIYWVEQEVRPPANYDAVQPATIAKELRLHFGTSVDVLTLLTRAAKDSGLIANDHLTEVFKVLSQICRTTYQEKPSAHSMLKKSYVAERSAKEAAIDFLHGMIKKVHGY